MGEKKKLLKHSLLLFLFIFICFSGVSIYQVFSRSFGPMNEMQAKAMLPRYYRFLKEKKEEGYVFWNFRTYLAKKNQPLPNKLIVIRHDVHFADVEESYAACVLEKEIIGNFDSATYYVQYKDPLEVNEVRYQKEYLKLIKYLKKKKVDVQPHISPIDFYIASAKPKWAELSKKEDLDEFHKNYVLQKSTTGTTLLVIGTDVFDFQDLNSKMPQLLRDYNAVWKKDTGLNVQGYASHGSQTPMNFAFNNANILDQQILLDSGIYQYDTYNTKIFNVLSYLSDNTRPKWITNPLLVKEGRYQFLMHPNVWRGTDHTIIGELIN